MYDAEVTNGGHAQYFVNSSGGLWKSAIEGLRAIGSDQRALVLQEATALFGGNGPSTDNDSRHHQLANFSKKQDNLLEELDSRYYSSNENVEVLLTLYATKNKEHFTSQK